MNILITNDDGYNSTGLRVLAETCLEAGHSVFVVAPSVQQSATSHSMVIEKPLLAKPFSYGNIKGYAVNGFPADCVRVAPYLTDKTIDFCIAGINNGFNVGAAVYYSGTDGAAREAAMNYIPSMALSMGTSATEDMLRGFSKLAIDKIGYFRDNPMPRMCFLNVNSPAMLPEQTKGERMATVSKGFFKDGYICRTSPLNEPYLWPDCKGTYEASEPGSDVYYLERGYITYTFIGGFIDHNFELQGFI